MTENQPTYQNHDSTVSAILSNLSMKKRIHSHLYATTIICSLSLQISYEKDPNTYRNVTHHRFPRRGSVIIYSSYVGNRMNRLPEEHVIPHVWRSGARHDSSIRTI